MRKLRVAIIHPGFSPNVIHKQPWYTSHTLALGLSKRGHLVTIFSDACSGVLSYNAKVVGISSFFLRFSLGSLATILRKFDAIIYFGNVLSVMLTKQLEKRLKNVTKLLYISNFFYSMHELRILTPCELKAHTIHLLLSLPLLRNLVAFVNNHSKVTIIVPSQGIKNSLMESGIHAYKILVAPLFFDRRLISPLYSHGSKHNVLNCNGSLMLTYFGSPLSIRGTDTLLRAFKLLVDEYRDSNLRMLLLLRVESDAERKEAYKLRKLSKRLGVRDKVTFIMQTLNRERLLLHLRESDIIALPFKIVQSEPPLTILESMALGKPLVTTATCGLPSLIPATCAFFSQPGNHVSLAQCIKSLVENNSLLNAISKNASSFISRLPGPEVFVSFVEDILCSNSPT